MRVRVPTGMKEVTVTASNGGVVCFRCVKCGQVSAKKCKVSGSGSGTYHVFQKREKKDAAVEGARQRAIEEANRELIAVETAVNYEHRYEVFEKEICCLHCGEKQPWSGIPGKPGWLAILLFVLSILVIAVPVGCAANLAAGIGVGALFAVLTGAYYIYSIKKRRKAIQTLNSSQFEAPAFVSENSVQAFLDGNDSTSELVRDVFSNDILGQAVAADREVEVKGQKKVSELVLIIGVFVAFLLFLFACLLTSQTSQPKQAERSKQTYGSEQTYASFKGTLAHETAARAEITYLIPVLEYGEEGDKDLVQVCIMETSDGEYGIVALLSDVVNGELKELIENEDSSLKKEVYGETNAEIMAIVKPSLIETMVSSGLKIDEEIFDKMFGNVCLIVSSKY